MGDAVRPSPDETRRRLAQSRQLWSSCAQRKEADKRLPSDCVALERALGMVPSYPVAQAEKAGSASQLKLEHRQLRSNRFELFIGGISTWDTSDGRCDLKPLVLDQELLYGTQQSTACQFSDDSRFSDWPGVQNSDEYSVNGNYLAVLTLAWAYVISTRWVDTQTPVVSKGIENADGLYYAQIQAQTVWDDRQPLDNMDIDIGEVDNDAARWWAAILAPDEGWFATIVRSNISYRSPWSYRLVSSQTFRLRRRIVDTPSSTSIPTFSTALKFLADFCELHHIHSQSIAALAAALLLPSLRGSNAKLPHPKPYHSSSARSCENYNRAVTISAMPRDIILHEANLLPYYMTLSSNTFGMRALLCGAFFNPEVFCNSVSPWLEPAFEILDTIVKQDDYELLALVMQRRQPCIAGFWLGAIITGMEKGLLQSIRSGLTTVNLHAGAWTGTAHSFINIIPSTITHSNITAISRADECRLLFLTGCEGYTRVPLCPWQPFGSTRLVDTDIEVRQHIDCVGHCLQYRSWRWNLTDELSQEDKGFRPNSIHPALVDYSIAFDLTRGVLKSEVTSEVATRSIFSWLRVHGYPAKEKKIYTHSWFDLEDSDEELSHSTSHGDDQQHSEYRRERIENWISNAISRKRTRLLCSNEHNTCEK